jgi:hypothetical protein
MPPKNYTELINRGVAGKAVWEPMLRWGAVYW